MFPKHYLWYVDEGNIQRPHLCPCMLQTCGVGVVVIVQDVFSGKNIAFLLLSNKYTLWWCEIAKWLFWWRIKALGGQPVAAAAILTVRQMKLHV